MKNLKKVLALVLAFACAFTMFASAADYTDQSSITHTDAVETLTALGILKGYDNGEFRPAGTITRGEMAKMIYTIRAGGNDDASGYASLSTTFKDITGHWAAGYIKYCQTMGIIAGHSATRFDPDGLVTVAETCKMALTVVGYTADKAGLIGTNWASKTLSLATEKKLLEDVSADFNGSCSRDNAAQILYNAIDAECVVWSNDKEDFVADSAGTNNTKYGITVGEKWLDMLTSISILDDVSLEDGKSTYTLTLETPLDSESTGTEAAFSKVAQDYTEYKHQKVKVLYKGKDKVYGVYPLDDDNTVLSGLLGDFGKEDKKLKFDGTKYSVDTVGAVATNNVLVDESSKSTDLVNWVSTNKKGVAKAFETNAIDNNGNGKINLLNVQSFYVGQITSVKTDYSSFNVTTKGTPSPLVTYTSSSFDEDEATWPEEMQKDDYVAISSDENSADGTYDVTILETVTGKITSTKKTIGTDDWQVYIGDTWYEIATQTPAANGFQDLKMNATVTVVVKDGYIVWVDNTHASTNDVALCIERASTGGVGSNWEADMLFADGTRDTVYLNKNTGWNGGTPTASTTPVLVSYEVDGTYELTAISATNKAGYDSYGAVTTMTNYVDSNRMQTASTPDDIRAINTDAVVFRHYKSGSDDKYDVVTGSDMRSWSKNSKFASYVLGDKTNGINWAKVVYADSLKKQGGNDLNYAYLFDGAVASSESGTNYMTYEAWNGTDDVELKVESNTTLPEGTVVEYTTDEDGITTFNTSYAKSAATKAAITGFDWTDNDSDSVIYVKDNGTAPTSTLNMKKDEDCFVLFIDTDDGSGATGSMNEADEIVAAPGTYTNNCAYWKVGNTVIMVVDTQNKLTVY